MTWLGFAAWSIVVLEYAVKIIAIGVVPENRRPSSSTAWLLLILFLPVVGVPLFLILGSPYINARRSEIQALANHRLREGTGDLPDYPPSVNPTPELQGIIELARSLTSLPMVTGRNHGILSDYDAGIERMTRLVEQAEEWVHVEIYIMARDATTESFFAALEDAVRRGVTVRVLLDHMGSRKYPGFQEFLAGMTRAGIEWHLMLPFQPMKRRMRRVDLRNHRKLMVVDGKAGIMGSQNLIGSTYGSAKNEQLGRRWNDISIEVSGEIVSSLEAAFAVDWFSECGERLLIHAYQAALGGDEDLLPAVHVEHPPVGGPINAVQLVPSGPGFRTEPNLRVFTSLMYSARERLAIVSPYFVPDESLMAAVLTAAYRGVRVELYVSEVADQFMVDRAQSSYYQSMLDAGVVIYRYAAPEVLHTKCFVVDDVCAVMGSSNMDMRSFGLNYEISLLAYGGDIVGQIQDVIAEYAERCSILDDATWKKRPLGRRYSESVMRLTSALQ